MRICDCSAIGTYASAGAQFGLGFLWTAPVTFPMMFAAVTPVGFPVIADFAHLRRARPDDPSQRIFRRAFNYDSVPGAGSVSDSGLIFASYQADIGRQFVPLQRRLDELDLLNLWTTPVGSAVFAIPPGCAPGGFVGEGLFA